jgi:hypothetical protein
VSAKINSYLIDSGGLIHNFKHKSLMNYDLRDLVYSNNDFSTIHSLQSRIFWL